MREADYPEFASMLDATCSLLSRGQHVPSAQHAAMWFRALAEFDLADVRVALDAHIRDPQRGRFVPVPADILAQLQAAVGADRRPGAEEAWAIALRAADEANTVVWTEEMEQAWSIAFKVYDNGDEVGARMAFREAYTRLVADAKAKGEPPHWSVSEGWDQGLRKVALEQAMQQGLLPREELVALPPAAALLALPAPTTEGVLALLLAPPADDGEDGQARTGPPPEVRRRLVELRAELAAREPAIEVNTTERDRLRDLKAETQRQVDAYEPGVVA